MTKKIDPTELIDSQITAELLGLGSRNAVSVYRARHSDFPLPIVTLGPGRPMLWLRADIEAWAKARAT